MIPSQILVHITAGSTAQDEARYRAQVAAILEFQCASRQLIEGPADRDPHLSDAEHSSVPSTTQHEVSPILREALRPAYTTLSSDHVPERDPPQNISNHDSLGSLISVIPDSQEIAQLVHASSSHAALSPPSQLAPPPKRRRTAPASPDPVQPVSIKSQTAVQSAAHIPFQNHILGFPNTEISSSDERRPSSHATPSHTPHAPPNLSLPIEIHPPRPPISTAPFTTHITQTLSMLADRLNPTRTYKPATQSRPLDPLERGYWLVQLAIAPHTDPVHQHSKLGTTSPTPREDPRIWPSPLFHAFWSFLSDFIGRDGRAGWGVWCILEDATPASISNTNLSLKVYAWGEVAMHVYLLLFLASERRIRGMGVQWRDASEEVVIQMP
ncbi:uncharacterized protein PGRI_083420 [Penicillium griseofulvum]|uniref:Uncharacterized protein n=1 Tax=Penicillium patulum TaxID=5078 RepID=A0A135LSV3_PENPA|nr:uncharacterized protein PGRI_083420 [Penicillium griseofulvum]KXG52058.1 hypothetical protein PGRI_083420 [Penicillium griseofulvum]